MSGSAELLQFAGGNGFAECLLAWRSVSGLAIAGGFTLTAAAAESGPETEPETAAAEPDSDTTAAVTGPEVVAEVAELAGGRESASATTLELPEVCLRSEVNSAKKERCRCCRFDQGGVTRVIAETSGL